MLVLAKQRKCCMQVPATQSLLVLASCERGCEELPPALLAFFQTQASTATSSSHAPSQHLSTHLMTHTSATALSNCGGSVASSKVIAVGSEAETAGSWQKAADRAANAAAATVASAAAFRFQGQLSKAASEKIHHAVHVGLPGNRSSVCEDPRSSAGPCSGQSQGAPRAVGDIVAANGLSEAAEASAQPWLGRASRGAKAVNENELQQGLALHAEVSLHRHCMMRFFSEQSVFS